MLTAQSFLPVFRKEASAIEDLQGRSDSKGCSLNSQGPADCSRKAVLLPQQQRPGREHKGQK